MRIAPPGIGAHIQTASLVTENRLQAMRIAPPGIGAHIQTASLVTEKNFRFRPALSLHINNKKDNLIQDKNIQYGYFTASLTIIIIQAGHSYSGT